jgi:CheY-like chemotaxis protein
MDMSRFHIGYNTPSAVIELTPAKGLPMSELPQILVVDDESAVRRVIRTCLERNDYQVFEAQSGEEALAIYRQSSLKIALVVSDIRMQGIDGNELGRRIHDLNPTQRILFVTAYPGDADDRAHRFDTLAKPFSVTQLLRKVAAQITRAAAV